MKSVFYTKLTSCQQAPAKKKIKSKVDAFKGRRTELGRLQVKQQYSLHIYSLIQSVVAELYACFTLSHIIILVPLTWRHSYVTQVTCMGIFSITSENCWKLLKLGNFLWLSYVPPSSFEVNNFAQMHKRCKIGAPFFFSATVKNFPEKLFYDVFYLFTFPLCLLSSIKLLPTYYTVGWTTNDQLLITVRFFRIHYSLQLM